MNNSGKLFFGGIPTDVDVDKLCKKFGIPEKDKFILHSEIEECIDVKWKSSRYNSIINAWRKKLKRENNLILKSRKGEGYICLDNNGRIELAANYYKQSIKKMSESIETAITTSREDLTPENLRIADHIQNTGASLRQAAMIEARKLNLKKIAE